MIVSIGGLAQSLKAYATLVLPMVTKNRARKPEANADCLIVTRKIIDLADFDETFALNYGLLGWRNQVCRGGRPDSRVKISY